MGTKNKSAYQPQTGQMNRTLAKMAAIDQLNVERQPQE